MAELPGYEREPLPRRGLKTQVHEPEQTVFERARGQGTSIMSAVNDVLSHIATGANQEYIDIGGGTYNMLKAPTQLVDKISPVELMPPEQIPQTSDARETIKQVARDTIGPGIIRDPQTKTEENLQLGGRLLADLSLFPVARYARFGPAAQRIAAGGGAGAGVKEVMGPWGTAYQKWLVEPLGRGVNYVDRAVFPQLPNLVDKNNIRQTILRNAGITTATAASPMSADYTGRGARRAAEEAGIEDPLTLDLIQKGSEGIGALGPQAVVASVPQLPKIWNNPTALRTTSALAAPTLGGAGLLFGGEGADEAARAIARGGSALTGTGVGASTMVPAFNRATRLEAEQAANAARELKLADDIELNRRSWGGQPTAAGRYETNYGWTTDRPVFGPQPPTPDESLIKRLMLPPLIYGAEY